jgi:hypothetical protein
MGPDPLGKDEPVSVIHSANQSISIAENVEHEPITDRIYAGIFQLDVAK